MVAKNERKPSLRLSALLEEEHTDHVVHAPQLTLLLELVTVSAEARSWRRLNATRKINVFAVANAAWTPPDFLSLSVFFQRASQWIIDAVSPASASLQSPEPISNPFVPVCSASLSPGLLRACQKTGSRGLVGFREITHSRTPPLNRLCRETLLDERHHPFAAADRAADDVFSTSFHFHSRTIDIRGDIMNLRDVSDDLEIQDTSFRKIFFATAPAATVNRFARRRATAALPVSDSVFA